MKQSDDSLPVVQAVEIVSPSRVPPERKILAEVTPKASGANKDPFFGLGDDRMKISKIRTTSPRSTSMRSGEATAKAGCRTSAAVALTTRLAIEVAMDTRAHDKTR